MADFFDDVDDALLAETSPDLTSHPLPAQITHRKRTRIEAGLPTEDDDRTSSEPPRPVNRNLVASARRIAEAHRLTAQQSADLDTFAADTLHVQNMRIYASLLALNLRVEQLVPPPAAFTLSADLIANIKSYAHGVIFSSKIALYKGAIPTNHLLDIVKRYRWGLPEGIENDTPKWKKVVKEAGDALTAVRRKIKIQLIASIKAQDPAKHWDIYDVAGACIKGTSYKITIPLLARLALMRGVFSNSANQGDDFWDHVDARLVEVAKKADGDADRLARLFKHFLDKDRKAHGSGVQPPVDENMVDNLQANIDQAIDERNRLLAANPKQADGDEDEDEEVASRAGSLTPMATES